MYITFCLCFRSSVNLVIGGSISSVPPFRKHSTRKTIASFVTFVHLNDVHKELCEMSLFGVHGHHQLV